MSHLQPFTFPDTGQTVRTAAIDGDPWFFANDVCAVLGIANVGNVLARLDDDEKSSIRLTDGIRGNPNRAVISEPGLYSVILRSDSPAARPFRRWVTREVLPAIRRTGSYEVGPSIPQTYSEALRELADTVEELDATKQRAAALEPSAQAWDALADAQGDYSLRAAAQVLDRDPHISTGQNRLSKYLKAIKWTDATGQPYQAQVDAGRLVRRSITWENRKTGEEKADSQLRITAKGLKDLRARMSSTSQLRLIDGGVA